MPWTADTVRPGLKILVPGVETLTVAALKAQAAPLGKQAVALIEAKAKWQDVQKTALVEAGAAVGAKWMNRFNVSAEYAPEVALAGAVGAVVTQYAILRAELAALAAELRDKPAPAGSPPAQVIEPAKVGA